MSRIIVEYEDTEEKSEHETLSARRAQRRNSEQKHKTRGKDPSSHYKKQKSAMKLRDKYEE